jgi:secondary thiamine-phosphate synthase enzyme
MHTTTHEVETHGQNDIKDVTPLVAGTLVKSGLQEGLATVTVVGSTAALTTMEFEPGAVADLTALLERLAPREGEYRHHLRWGDDNGSSHLRAALLGPSVSIPFTEGRLRIGTWQQIVLIECDTQSRRRQLVVHLAGT